VRLRLTPQDTSFFDLLTESANNLVLGAQAVAGLFEPDADRQAISVEVQRIEHAEDEVTHTILRRLNVTFVTPFDRQDIYSLSVEMDRVVQYSKSTLMEMEAFIVVGDTIIKNMVQQLKVGTDLLAEAIQLLKEDPRKSQLQIGKIRKVQFNIEDEYRTGIVALFNSQDPMHAIKYREVYHHIKDAEIFLGYTTDVLHKIIVRII